MKHTNKKGFTIVELVIVIAVIAILAAVLIPTFSNLIKKANESSDVQAVRQMNTILAAEGAVEKNNIFEVFAALQESNMDAKDYKPLVSGHYFFWDDKADRIVYTDAEFNVIFPKDFDMNNKGNWFSLTQTIEAKKPADTNYADGIKIESGAEMLYVLNEVNEGNVKNATITIPATGIDMMGAVFGVTTLNTSLTIEGENGAAAVISNAISIDTTKFGDGVTEGNMGQYSAGLFGSVAKNQTLTINNVTFKNVHVKNTNTTNIAVLVGTLLGNLELNNVTIEDCSVIGNKNVGAVVGSLNGKITGSVALKNVDVGTIGGRSGMVIGRAVTTTNLSEMNITIDDKCSFYLLRCDQNTGTSPEGKELGYDATTGLVKSWAYTGTWTEDYSPDRYFVEGSLAALDATGQETANSFFKTIPGWND